MNKLKKYNSGLIIVLILVGIVLIIYPAWDDHRIKKQQLSILTQWDSLYVSNNDQHDIREKSSLASSNGFHIEGRLQSDDEDSMHEIVEEIGELEENVPIFEPIMYHGEQMVGKLLIESIEVSQPIMDRATESALNLGMGIVVTDRSPIESDNFVLAGHRGRSYGRLLNRLHELEEGDIIIVETQDGIFEYETKSSFLVTPDDLSVLDEEEGHKELTLITCHPIRNPTHRLIVKASLKTEDNNLINS